LTRQYIKNLGRELEVETIEGAEIEGKLIAADHAGIELDEEKGKGKKLETIKHFILFDQIKSAKVKVVF
jgi:ribosome maturation factor RimP